MPEPANVLVMLTLSCVHWVHCSVPLDTDTAKFPEGVRLPAAASVISRGAAWVINLVIYFGQVGSHTSGVKLECGNPTWA